NRLCVLFYRQDLDTPDLTTLQQRIQKMEGFQKQLKLRSFLKGKEEKVKLLITRLEQIKASSQAQNEDVRPQEIDEVQWQISSETRLLLENKAEDQRITSQRYGNMGKYEQQPWKKLLNFK
ncbi:hypothetical protein GOODEAATRI_028381, partial [Goodea atripinnis]